MRNDRRQLEQVMAAVMLGYHAQVREFVLLAPEGWLTYATIVTQRGTVVVERFGADSPLTVSNFVALARRVVTAGSRFIASSRTSWHRTAIHAVMEVMGQGTRFAMNRRWYDRSAVGWCPPVPTREEARAFSRIRLSPNWTDITQCVDTSARDSMCSTPLCRAIESLA